MPYIYSINFVSYVFHKYLLERQNSVYPDQTAPQEQSDLGLHCLHKPVKLAVQNLGQLPYGQVIRHPTT